MSKRPSVSRMGVPGQTSRQGAVERILLVRGDGLGDAVLGTGFLAAVRRARPRAHITLAVREGLASFFEDCPWVDQIMPFPRPSNDSSAGEASIINLMTARAMQQLRSFDVVVDLQCDNNALKGSMHVAATVPARLRIAAPLCGPQERLAMEQLYDEVIDLPSSHEVVRYAALAERLGAQPQEPQLWNQDAHLASALRVLGRDEAWASAPKVFLHVGASEARRRWPAHRFAEVVDRLRQYDVDVVVVGARDEAAKLEMVAGRAGRRGIALAGTLTPMQLGALMHRGGLFIGNDSGPMHLAACAGRPVVEISMHPADGETHIGNAPERFGPWGVPSIVARPDSFMPGCGPVCLPHAATVAPHCILKVTVDEVWSAVEVMVSAGGLLVRADDFDHALVDQRGA